MKKIIFALSLLILVSLHAFGFEVGDKSFNPVYTAVPLLTIAPDARAGGMGDVGAATSADVNSQFWNPAKYVFAQSPAGFGMSYTPWLSQLVNDINLLNLTGYWQFDERQAVSASLRYFSLGDVIFREGPHDPGITVRPNEFAIDLAYSRLLSERFSAAVAFRYIRSDLNVGFAAGAQEMLPGNAFATDVAMYHLTPIRVATGDANLAFGLNISNIGTKITYDDGVHNYFIPANMRFGTSFDFPFDNFNRLSINIDLNKLLVPTMPDPNSPDFDVKFNEYNNMSSIAGIFRSFSDAPGGFREELQEIMWAIGLEYNYSDQFFVRAGYFHEHQLKGNRRYFTAGAGFKLNVFQLDLGYVIALSPANPLDQTLRFSLSFDLGGLRALTQ